MKVPVHYDVIIVGGSYAGLAAGMALGRALRRVLIIDSGRPCNRQTPYSHNFLTRDGETPHAIASLAKKQVEKYNSVSFFNGRVTQGIKTGQGFEIRIESGDNFTAKKLVFASGIKDIMPGINGFADCWGISVLHCPYCHGYEVKNEKTGVLANGDKGFEFAMLISNWTKDLSLFTNGKSTLTAEQMARLDRHHISIVETEIEGLSQQDGFLQNIVFKGGTRAALKVLYASIAFAQHCTIPQDLGCELSDEGYITVNAFQQTTVPGIYACGDNTSRMRTVANAVASGTAAGMMVNKELVLETF